MTNETAPHENGVADEAAIAAITVVGSETPDLVSEVAAPVEPALPSFDDLGLHPDIKAALDDMGYFAPTPVQTAVYKPVSEGKDLLVQSRTGTGKTTAFGLPTLNNLIPTHHAPQALILAPTRELALQVARELTQLGKHRGIRVEPIYGGAPIGKQITALKNGVHVVVGTPGRVLDHIGRRTLDCRTIQTFILDECDEMLSMGFLEDIERVVSHLPEKKQTLLFSATMPDEVSRYARRHMRAPEQISLSRDSISVSEIHHAYYIVSGIARSRDLLKIIFAEEPESAIIFCNMRDETTMVAKFLQKQGLDAEPLSSDLSQSDRERVMGRMKQKNLRFLVATDVAARGIDISDLSHVINYSVPEQPEIYVHRTGRTGRAGKKGTALSMVGPRELGNFRYVRLTFGIKPDERVLPKDDIFVGKLKHPLPPVGTPQPPDPIQILTRGVAGTPSDLERQIFEKLLGSANGKRVLALLVAEKLDKLTTRSRPKREPAPEAREAREARDGEHPAREERTEGGERGEDRGERRFDRDGERPRRFDRDGDRPRRFDRDERGGGERGGGERGGGERGAGGERGGGERGAGGERGGGDRDGGPRRFDRDGERPRRFDGDRPRRFDRDERPARDERPGRDGRERDRDRERAEAKTSPRITVPPIEASLDAHTDMTDAPQVIEGAPDTTIAATASVQPVERDRDRDRDRDREPRHRRDRDRGRDRFDRSRDDRPRASSDEPRREPEERAAQVEPASLELPNASEPRESIEAHEVGTEAAPDVETVAASHVDLAPSRVEDVARAVIERADRGDHRDRGERKGKRDRGEKKEASGEAREFWETWADEKSARPVAEAHPPVAEAPRPAPVEAATEAAADPGERKPKRDRDRGRGGRDKDRGRVGRDKDAGRDKDRGRDKPAEAKADVKDAAPSERPKRDEAAADGAQARLFVSLGKKHGVTADDLRGLLAGPVGGQKERIGSVSLRDSHAHVRVPEELVDAIIAGVHGTQHNEHDITVERARA